MTPLNESTIEHHAITLFKELGYAYAFGPDIGPDSNHLERADYENPLLLERLRHAVHRLNPEAPKEIRDEALRHVQAIAVGGLMTENSLFQQMLVEGVRVAHMVDEAQRSQYEILDGYAANLRAALPNATFVAFTGTPLELDDRDTGLIGL